jgi:hypothetical protein
MNGNALPNMQSELFVFRNSTVKNGDVMKN